MTTNNPPLATVQRMFDAFRDGALDRLIETVHPDSRWTYIGANPRPAKGTYVGKDGARRFFETVLRNLSMTTFQPTQFVAENDTVVVFGFESGTVKRTGTPFRNEWAQKYVVRNGLIMEMAEYNIQVDTAA
jgi:uncharacterized protein